MKAATLAMVAGALLVAAIGCLATGATYPDGTPSSAGFYALGGVFFALIGWAVVVAGHASPRTRTRRRPRSVLEDNPSVRIHYGSDR